MTPAAPGPDLDFDTVAWSWVEHLRQRGTLPWQQWVAEAEARPLVDVPSDRSLPGAAQLEAVRRLAGRPQSPAVPFPQLADLVLRRAAPGRGPDDLPLLWVADGRPERFGPPPVDPERLPEPELVRVLVGAVAELLVRTPPVEPAPAPPVRRRPRSRRRRPAPVRVVGSPALAAPVRSALAAAGHVPGRPPDKVVVLAEPVERLLSHAWSLRVQRGGVATWPGFVQRWAKRDALPTAADVAALAARWAGAVGAGRVHVLVAGPDPDPAAAVRRVFEDVLGHPVPAIPDPEAASLAPAAVELLRRVNRVLRSRVAGQRHRELLQVLRPLLPQDPHGAVVPARHAAWVRAAGLRSRDVLCGGGYHVHGDPDSLLAEPEGTSGPAHWDLLGAALDTCLSVAGESTTAAVLQGADL